MSYSIPNRHYLDDLYFNMREYFLFENDFTSNLPNNYITTHVICLVDAQDIENWKSINSYESSINFIENCDKISFDNYQSEIHNQNQVGQKNIKKLKIYETLDEVCDSLKKGGRISIIGHQFLCYMNEITYTKKCFKCYTKNNQLIIYFGNGKCFFIPRFFPDKILDSENVYIVDLPGDKTCLIEAIFDNNKKYQNMFESIKSIGSKNNLQNSKMTMTNLLSYNVDKNELKKFKNYNFYLNEEEKNNENININEKEKENIVQQNNNIYANNNYIISDENYINKNNNDIIYNYNNNYYINYEENGLKPNIIPNYIYITNNETPQYYYNKEKEIDYINNNNININEYPRDSNENININNNNIYINNQNIIQEEKESDNLLDYKDKNEIKEKDEQNNYIEIENQEEKEKEEEKIKYQNTESQNQIDQEQNIFYINDLNNKETLLKQEKEKEKEKSKDESNINLDTESQNQIDQEKAIFYINYKNNQRTNPELKDIDISSNLSKSVNNNINNTQEKEKEEKIPEEFDIQKIKQFPTLGLDNESGNNSYINSTLQCLINTTPLVQYFLQGKNISNIPEVNDDIKDIKLLPSFLQILKKLWTNENPNLASINPEAFITKLKSISSAFNKNEENDIGELIIFLLEQIYSEAKENNENNNASFIYDIFFGGKKELTTECLTCINNNREKKFVEEKDLYYLMFRLNNVYDFVISNKIKENNIINIYDCLNYYESPKIIEQNGKECDLCGNKDAFLITSKIKKCQNNLLVLLNQNFNSEEKKENIKFELNEIIDMKNFIKENENKEKILYGLYAIICLSISFEENKNKIHHVAFCKSPVDGKWYKYDDNIVETVTELENEVDKFGMPVALFYQKNEENLK